MSTLTGCPECGSELVAAGFEGHTRQVCSKCGRCWEARVEVDTLACPGCAERPICESRPTALVGERTSTHRLADGTGVLIRPLLYSDRHALEEGYKRLSDQSRRLRFFAAPKELSREDLEYLTNLDYHDHFAWAAFASDAPDPPGIGVARYVRDRADPTRAEAAVTVLDAFQHRGLGTLLLLLLVDEARNNGITTFVSYVLWDNEEVLEGLRQAGASVGPGEAGIATVEIEIPPAEEPTPMEPIHTALRHFARATRTFLGWAAPARAG